MPRVGALNHPASGRVTATGHGRWDGFTAVPPMSNMHPIAQALRDLTHFGIIVTFVGAEMAHDQISRAVTP